MKRCGLGEFLRGLLPCYIMRLIVSYALFVAQLIVGERAEIFTVGAGGAETLSLRRTLGCVNFGLGPVLCR